MQIDMHLYGVYAIARAAGIKDRTARAIAFASQYVDDAVEDEEVVVAEDYALLPAMTSHKPLDFENALKGDQWKVWLPFHFLPGNEPKNGPFIQRLVCRKNSKVARKMFEDALDEKNRPLWPHLIGITAHVFADTFSHHGFIGISSNLNKVKSGTVKTHNIKTKTILEALEAKLEKFSGILAQLIPVGHGSVATYPDIPFLSWEFEYESSLMGRGTIKRENAVDFLEGAKELHYFFGQYAEKSDDIADPETKRQWEDIKPHIKNIIAFQHQDKDDRIEKWRQTIRDGALFNPTNVDKGILYNKHSWELTQLKDINASRKKAKESNACKFLRASQYHRFYVLHELLPQFDLLVN
jgi:hypothetical protein